MSYTKLVEEELKELGKLYLGKLYSKEAGQRMAGQRIIEQLLDEGHQSNPPKVKEVYEDYLAYCKDNGLTVPKAYATSDRKDISVNRQFNKKLKERYGYSTSRRKNGTVFLGLVKK